jgi:carbamoylphosphate synthase large subunit
MDLTGEVSCVEPCEWIETPWSIEGGYPVLLRPSYVLGGRAMQLVQDVDALGRCMVEAAHVSGQNPVLMTNSWTPLSRSTSTPSQTAWTSTSPA